MKLARLPFARIAWRLLLLNTLLVFLPLAGLLSFASFEHQLLTAQERAMVQQGRLLAAALAGPEALDAARAEAVLRALERRTEARLRVVDRERIVVADSALLGPRQVAKLDGGSSYDRPTSSRDAWIYRLGAGLYRWLRGEPALDPLAPAAGAERLGARLDGSEIEAALAGRYGALTRRTPGTRSLTLSTAIPVRSASGEIVGAVVVGQSTARILAALWTLRLDLFEIVLVASLVAAGLSLLFAGTITRPLARLRAEAEQLTDAAGHLRRRFRGSTRQDEIGDLARALERLTARLDHQLAASERFAADVAHELKNPLAAIRSASELAADAEDPADRVHLARLVAQEVGRLERLLGQIRELGHLDSAEPTRAANPVALGPLVDELLAVFRERFPALAFARTGGTPEATVHVPAELLARLLENLVDNAASFSPSGGRVEIRLAAEGDEAVVTVTDEGPGIPESHLGRIFDRFFTHRPEGGPRHDGLGLALAKAIAERHGGTLQARNRHPGPGALFELRLPR
jgi:two-component system, OmpR family, sensor histidine kinase ChvG